MPRSQPVVAELGRPETPEETAARKAESSLAHRASQTPRNLVAALLVTLAVVAVIVFAVPRGEPAPRAQIDVATAAQQAEQARDRIVVVPDVPVDWSVNGASVETEGVDAWTIIYAPASSRAFLRVEQGFDTGDAWAARVLRGASPRDTIEIGGVTWDRYEIDDPAVAGNVSRALGVQAGRDHILVYGNAELGELELVAESLADQVRRLQEDAS